MPNSVTITAFDSDVLIYSAQRENPTGHQISAHFESPGVVATGSHLLAIEVLAKPLREDPTSREVEALTRILGTMDLYPLDEPTSHLAVDLAAAYRLRAADATHLATAIISGADQFLTNNRKDFPKTIAEIEVVYPEDL